MGREEGPQVAQDPRDPRFHGVRVERRFFRFGKIDRRFEEDEHVGYPGVQGRHRAAQASFEVIQGQARPRDGVGVNQVGDGLGLRQVQAPVQEGAAGEFSGTGRTRPGPHDLVEQRPEGDRTAVTVDLDDVLARVGARGLHQGQQDLVDPRAGFRDTDVTVIESMGVKGRYGAYGMKEPAGDGLRVRSADPDDPDTPPAGGRRDGGDGVMKVHGGRPDPGPVCCAPA